MNKKAVITASTVDLPYGEDNAVWQQEHQPLFRQLDKSEWHSPQLGERVTMLAGTSLKISFMPQADMDKSRVALNRKSSFDLYKNLKRLIGKAGMGKVRKQHHLGIAYSLAYSFFSNDLKVNLFNFRTNIEHQTPAPVGDWLGCTGPQFVVKEGDTGDLIGLAVISAALEYMPGPILLCGTAEPHPLLTCMELIRECSAARMSTPENEKIEINTRFSEGVASLFLETRESADKGDRIPLAQIIGTYYCTRNFDYQNIPAIEHHLAGCFQRILKFSSGNIGAVFGCFRRNQIVRAIEWKLLKRWLPGARIIDAASYLGDVSPISGLVDLFFAVNGFQTGTLPGGLERTGPDARTGKTKKTPISVNDSEMLIYKISRLGNFAGVLIRSGS